MKYAVINDNLIKQIIIDNDEYALSLAPYNQHILDITSQTPEPQVGWVFDNGIVYRNIPSVTPRQIRQALILSGVSLAMIDAALNSLPEPTRSLAIAEWEYSNTFERRRDLVTSVGLMLGWTSEQLDQLWLFAGSLK